LCESFIRVAPGKHNRHVVGLGDVTGKRFYRRAQAPLEFLDGLVPVGPDEILGD